MTTGFVEKYTRLPQAVRASFWFAICSFLQRGISVITTPIFTRLLTEAEYGQYGVFNSWMSILTCVITLSLYWGLYTQGLVKFEAERERFSSAMQGLCTTLITGWSIIYLLFRDFWNRLFALTTVQMLAMLLLIWCASMFSFWSAKQRVDYRYRGLVIITLLVSIVNPVLGIFLVRHAQDKVTARILGVLLVDLLAYSWMFFAQLKRNKTFFSARFWRYALVFNIPLIPHYLSGSILNSADRIMIKSLIGDSAAGLYTLAYSISQVMTVFNSALLQTIEPWLYKRINRHQTRDIAPLAYPVFCGIAVVNLLLIVLAPEVIALFAPPSYHDAIWVIPPVAMSVYFSFLYSFFATFEFYFEKTKYITMATMAGAVLNLILNAVFIPLYGYVAAGYTTLICYIVYAVFHYSFMCRLCRQQGIEQVYSFKWLLLISLLFMVVGFLLLATYPFAWVRYAILAVVLLVLLYRRQTVMVTARTLLQLKKE